jgi:hypothetical protein
MKGLSSVVLWLSYSTQSQQLACNAVLFLQDLRVPIFLPDIRSTLTRVPKRGGRGRSLGLKFTFCTVHSLNTVLVLGILRDSSQKSLHLVVILFLVLSLAASLLSSGFTFYNSISNPYQTFLGPIGVYTWNGLSGEFPPTPKDPLLCGQSNPPLSVPLIHP